MTMIRPRENSKRQRKGEGNRWKERKREKGNGGWRELYTRRIVTDSTRSINGVCGGKSERKRHVVSK